MLTVLIGRSPVERGKSIGICLLLVLLGISLLQLSSARAEAVNEDHARKGAADTARLFALALMTYDYAHLSIQAGQVAGVSSVSVVDRLAAASRDVIFAEASSVGDVTAVRVATLTASQADVFVWTSQMVRTGAPLKAETTLARVLDLTLFWINGRWMVAAFSWLLSGSAP